MMSPQVSVDICLGWWYCGWWSSWTFPGVLPFLSMWILGALIYLMVLFFLVSSWVVSLEMLSIISCILVHYVGEVSNLALFLMGSSSSLSLCDLSMQYSPGACVRFNPVSCWIPSNLMMYLLGVSGIVGLILGMRPLGGFFFSIAVVSNCIWWLALSKVNSDNWFWWQPLEWWILGFPQLSTSWQMFLGSAPY